MHVCLCLGTCMWVQVPIDAKREHGLDPVELELQVAMVLGTVHRPFARAVYTLNRQPISIVPTALTNVSIHIWTPGLQWGYDAVPEMWGLEASCSKACGKGYWVTLPCLPLVFSICVFTSALGSPSERQVLSLVKQIFIILYRSCLGHFYKAFVDGFPSL